MLLEQIARHRDRNHSRGEVLYHREIGFPNGLKMPRGFSPVINLNYGSHSRYEAMSDRYGSMKLPRRVDVRDGEIFEIGVVDGVVTKMGVRFSYDDVKDIILIIMPATGFVKTVWANLKTDHHRTLDRSKYATP